MTEQCGRTTSLYACFRPICSPLYARQRSIGSPLSPGYARCCQPPKQIRTSWLVVRRKDQNVAVPAVHRPTSHVRNSIEAQLSAIDMSIQKIVLLSSSHTSVWLARPSISPVLLCAAFSFSIGIERNLADEASREFQCPTFCVIGELKRDRSNPISSLVRTYQLQVGISHQGFSSQNYMKYITESTSIN